MVCDGPDPPENNPHELSPPPRHDLLMNGPQVEDSDDENEYVGYEPLPQGPEISYSDQDLEEDDQDTEQSPNNIPPIESVEVVLTREVWNTPRNNDPIQMDSERAQQVMSAMANFSLPQTSIPEWARSISEDQWKRTLNEQIQKIKSNS
ncbi:male-enhanced antigen 1 [Bombyx mandarina]|uniref:Male-enhanced antigen 1 n=1 Tax=Bombyx mandarina TaxID=7092 RepID=A0A6J2JY04_BOMMA|nr:male-enhanced antigen 1 [Bombyx mandarina]